MDEEHPCRPCDSYGLSKKLGEETAELVASLATGDQPGMVAEAADLMYHLLVALRAEEISAADLLRELANRA